jgi:hypothetical protein
MPLKGFNNQIAFHLRLICQQEKNQLQKNNVITWRGRLKVGFAEHDALDRPGWNKPEVAGSHR